MRRFPASRRHPHFAREQLEPFLATHGIAYRWLPELGGRRTPRRDSPNTGWREPGFRGYADYMASAEFQAALNGLSGIAAGTRTSIMCAEALWWQCHRRLIADALLARGHAVRHIQSADAAPTHALMPPAHLVSGQLSYAAEQPDLPL